MEGHLLALHITPANEQNQDQMGRLAFVDQGYTSDEPAQAAQGQGMRLEVVKLPHLKSGFYL